MLFKTLTVTAAIISLAVIPVKGADHQIIVGGTGVLAYTPNQVVRYNVFILCIL